MSNTQMIARTLGVAAAISLMAAMSQSASAATSANVDPGWQLPPAAQADQATQNEQAAIPSQETYVDQEMTANGLQYVPHQYSWRDDASAAMPANVAPRDDGNASLTLEFLQAGVTPPVIFYSDGSVAGPIGFDDVYPG